VGGAPLRVFDGGTVEQGLDDGGLDQALETIAWWRGERQRHGWLSDIIIETHDSMARSERLLQLQDALGDQPVDVLWDTHHTWKKGAEAVPQTWAAISRWVRHVHVKDSVSIPSQRHPYTYVLPGTGEFPLLETLRMLNDAGYPHIVSLEWEKLWHPYLVGMDAALEAMAACHARLQA
jgi:sugar phosphate isomerase/epimerase